MIPSEACHPGTIIYYVDRANIVHKAMINSLSTIKEPCPYVKLHPLLSYDKGGRALFNDLSLLGVPITAVFTTLKEAMCEIKRGTCFYSDDVNMTVNIYNAS